MAKRIIVLSDGTGNSAAKVWRTNVWRVFEALGLSGTSQVAFCDDGIGASSFKPFAIFGGMLEYALKRNVWCRKSTDLMYYSTPPSGVCSLGGVVRFWDFEPRPRGSPLQ
jgi:hypothetical protein